MEWKPVLKLKPTAERFQRRTKVKMIIERIIKALLKNKLIYSSELIYNHDHKFEYVLTEESRITSFSWTYKIFGFEKMLLFSSRYMF